MKHAFRPIQAFSLFEIALKEKIWFYLISAMKQNASFLINK